MKILYLRQPKKFIKKSSPQLYSKLESEIHKIAKNPFSGSTLKGKHLNHLRIHKFILSKTHYRVLYEIKNQILIIYIASRENFYRDLKL